MNDDLSPLAWVSGELRRSLEAAHKSLRRYLKEAEAAAGGDLDAVDPAVLRAARAQLHQGVGALELVGLPAAANVLRASEAAVQRLAARPALVNAAAVETIEKASFALLDFLARQLAGKSVSPVMLFPQYRAALQLAGADRVHPADLWKIDWQWRELPADAAATPRNADNSARGEMETLALTLMRRPAGDTTRAPLDRLSDLCADLAAGARVVGGAGTHHATFWQLAAAVFQAQASGLLMGDVYIKRLASRLLAQLRMRENGQDELSDRLAQDLLFFCSHAKAPMPGREASRLAAVRKAWNLDAQPTADYETSRLGRFDPAVMALARKRVAAARDSWSAVAGGELHRLTALPEQFALVGESLQRMLPHGEQLAQSLQAAVAQTVAAETAPAPALAMEVATGILYLDASLEDGEFDDPELGPRVQHLAQRVDEVRAGAEPRPLDSWMEELYRRVSDRQTMGSVVQELRASLSEIEKQIDQYFRDPSRRQLLIPVPAQLSAMRGVLSVLGLEQASAAALHMRDDVDALAQTEVDPQRAVQAGTFDRLADNLGALSFLIDMLSVQPALAKSLFRFDPEIGSLSAVMGQSERVSAFAAFDETAPAPVEAAPAAVPLLEQLREAAGQAASPHVSDDDLARQLEPLAQRAYAADQPELARLLGSAQTTLRGRADAAARRAVRAELVEAVAALAPPAAPPAPPPAPLPAAKPAPAGGTGLEDDAEMRDIFIEEAREVIVDAHAALERLAEAPDNASDLTAVRRAFHTLKGSSRMVGLSEFGEGGWACEQLYNARLAQAPRMDGALRQFTIEALNYLAGWTEAIAAGEDRGHRAADLSRAADALRLDGERLPIVAPGQAAASSGEAADETTQLMLRPPAPRADEAVLDLGHVDAAGAATPGAAPPASVGELIELAFEPPPEETADAAAAAAAVLPDLFDFPPLPELTVSDTTAPDAATRASALPLAEDISGSVDLAFDLGDGEEVPPVAADVDSMSPTVVFDQLAARVPDLPSAADLDLGQFGRAPAADAPPVFDLDLGAFEGSEAAAAATPREEPAESLALLDLPRDAPAEPMPEGEALEIDLADLEDLFPDAGAAAPAAEPAPEAAPVAARTFDPVQDTVLLPPQGDAAAEPAATADERPFSFDLDAAPPASEAVVAASAEEDEEQVRVIGPLRISIPLFNIYLNEADELSRRLVTELAEWGLESARRPVPDSAVALAHSLAGSSATVGYSELSALARALEHALMRSRDAGRAREGEPLLFSDAADEIRRLLHQFAAGFLRPVVPGLMERLAAHERLPLPDAEAPEAGFTADEAAVLAGIDVEDTIDHELLPIFEEEADELLPQLQSRLRDWHDRPADPDAPMACMRTLHTLKGGARLAGAMRLGEVAHRLETDIESLATQGEATAHDIEPLMARADAMSGLFDALRRQPAAPRPVASQAPTPRAEPPATTAVEAEPLAPEVAAAHDPHVAAAVPLATADASALETPGAEAPAAAVAEPEAEPTPAPEPESEPEPEPADAVAVEAPLPEIDWARFTLGTTAEATGADRATPPTAVVRVRASLLDRLVNQAGEVSITRARIDSDVKQLQGSLNDLTDSLDRMRKQLRDIELQAETQIATRIEAAKAASTSFDPLEMDRFTRFQELTRFMAESVNDVATLQRSLQRTLQSSEDELAAQARLTRELQDDLLRTRMVEFESLSERLQRTVRQAARETGKQVKLEIVGGAIEVDRGVLERMIGSFEHLLRNCVAHGIEPPAARTEAGKEAAGTIQITLAQAGNEVAVEFADDGGGLDLARIRQRAVQRGLLDADAAIDDAELAQFIFRPGFSTAETVTEIAGRGVGLDVVRAEVNGMGGRVETLTDAGKGTRFKLLLPLTTAVTQVVMLRCGEQQIAVPSTLIETVRRVPNDEVTRAYGSLTLRYADEDVPFYWLGALLRAGSHGLVVGRTQMVVVIRSAAQRVAVHIDEVVGNQEVVVKNVGPQLARLPGLAGVTLLPSGAVSLIYNPVALATLYGDEAHARMRRAEALPAGAPVAPQADEPVVPRAPLVMVVDDSLTVRRVTQRLLVREGYRVVTAKDGLDALDKLADELPVVVLSDIEMPRMDGFDLLRNVRADERLAPLPVIMITSRTAQKHRDYAEQLGANHYLGKPYSEEELLTLVARYAGADVPA
ncbi:MAG: hybrid sensor histidine kinase/response regulator [Leptothrix sp. (in: Bacteria)]|nr:hybrid sensor histidine kinase/response regulator [Leptothrix sp. (in: b-proteobacteria)]